jgi:hypothetical protein
LALWQPWSLVLRLKDAQAVEISVSDAFLTHAGETKAVRAQHDQGKEQSESGTSPEQSIEDQSTLTVLHGLWYPDLVMGDEKSLCRWVQNVTTYLQNSCPSESK